MKFALCFALLLSVAAHAAPTCKVLVDDTVRMPNGPETMPFSNIKILKTKGYNAVLVDYPTPKAGEYSLTTNVRCGTAVFNPWLSNCETRVVMKNDSRETVAEGVSTMSMNLGVFSADVDGAIRDLPDCSQL